MPFKLIQALLYSVTLCASFGALDLTTSAFSQEQLSERRFDYPKELQTKIGKKVKLYGVAGYMAGKHVQSCLWLMGQSQYVPVALQKWPDELVGRPIAIVGTVILSPRYSPDLPVRSPPEGEVSLVEVCLENGVVIPNPPSPGQGRDPFK